MGEGTDVQFFPEGGELVNGLASRVAFKATGPGGRGIPVSGVVLNRKNDTLVQLNTVHAGMGNFTLTPVSGEQYRASITLPDGTAKEVALPAARERSEARRVGTECVRQCRSRGSPCHKKKKTKHKE